MIGVYIVRDVEGAVLYVGSASNIAHRLEAHRSKAGWWSSLASIEQRPTVSRQMAYHLERELILTLKPKHNRTSINGAKSTSKAVGPVVRPRTEALARLIESFGSVAALASEVGCNHMTMSDIWRGVAFPSAKIVARLIVISGIPFDELFYVDPGDLPQSEWLSRRPARKAQVSA